MSWILLIIGVFFVAVADRRSSEPLWLECLYYFLLGAVPLSFALARFPLGLVAAPLALSLGVRHSRYKVAAALLGALAGWIIFFWLGILAPPGL